MRTWLAWMAALLALVAGAPAAAGIDLLRDACHATSREARDPATLAYQCGTRPPEASDRWLWLRADPAAVARVGGRDTLLVDQSRFARLVLIGIAADGSRSTQEIDGTAVRPGEPTLGAQLRLALAGERPAALYLGFDRLDSTATMRKWTAWDPAGALALERRWLLLIGLFAGTLGATLIFGLFHYAALRTAFHFWYALWAAVTLGYGLWWTGLVFTVAPWLGGTDGVRATLILLALCFAVTTKLFAVYVEPHVLPVGYRRLLDIGGVAMVAAGFVAALDMGVPALLGDRLLNLAIIAQIGLLLGGIVIAARAGSRAVWFYALAWAPTILVVCIRVARNFGLLPQTDAVDMATFAALCAQAVLLLLGNADRYARLQRERNAAIVTEAALRRLSETDPLTGLANRRALIDRAAVAYALSRPVGLILVDLDHFKRINDTHGHSMGDAVLKRVGEALGELVRRGDHVARYGGEEFAVLAETAGMAELAELAERLREGLAGLALDELAPGLQLTASLGVCHGDELDDARFEALFEAADKALYRAKAAGRNQVVIGAPERRVRLVAAG